MRESDFVEPAGRFEKNHDNDVTFVPDLLPPDIQYDSLLHMMDDARGQLGILEGLGRIIPNPSLLIRPYLTKEAVYSSRIEGTMASMMDVFRFELEQTPSEYAAGRRVQEVYNYIKALHECLAQIDDGEHISLNMLRHAHRILLDRAPGHDTKRGIFRTRQNWIGPRAIQHVY